MKKKLVIIALVCIVLLIFAGCQKANPASDFEYKVVESEGIGTHVAITKYIGTDLDVVIPKEIEGLPVASIYQFAFSGADIKSVFMHDSIVHIGAEAFYNCENLESVRFSKNLITIRPEAFVHCTALKEIILPDGVKLVEGGAFERCSAVEKIYLPGTVTNLGTCAFSVLKNLKDVTIGDGIEVLPSECFSYAEALEEITIPASVKEMFSDVFRGCKNLDVIRFEGNAPEFLTPDYNSIKPSAKIYYKKGTAGWDTCPLRETNELIEY